MKYPTLLAHFPIISDQISEAALAVILAELEQVLELNVPGDIAEFGCYVGTTSLFIRRLLNEFQQSDHRLFYVYDSFAGLPEKTAPDDSTTGIDFKGGALRASKKQLIQTFQKAHITPPIIHKAWFKDLQPIQVPGRLAFAFLDGDFYESINQSLHIVWPRLQSGGRLTIDDYQREALPGVTKAVNDFFASKPINLRYERNIAIIKKS
jgi:O-methyltransferase